MAIPKAEGRDEFFAEIDKIKPKLDRFYGVQAALIEPNIDKGRLQRAVNKRHVYWKGLAVLKKVVQQKESLPVTA